MCAKTNKKWKPEARDSLSIAALSLIIILVRTLFSPPPIILPSPHEFTQIQQPFETELQPSPATPPSPAPQTTHLFNFDPNTLDSAGFLRLGFSPAQTHSLLRYRSSGAQFRKPEDFSRSYVVSEQMYQQLLPYIRIDSTIELNSADTTQLKRLRGIGPYYAKKIVSYRNQLGGFIAPEQMMEIEGIDKERFAQFAPQIVINQSLVHKINLKTADQSTLSQHPYIGPYAARQMVHDRELLGDSSCTLSSLLRRNVLQVKQVEWLTHYIE